jgi:hypothetical protein
MNFITPTKITDAILSSHSVPETDFAAWSASTAYTVGQKCILVSTHSIYQRLVAGTTPTSPDVDTVNWIRVGPTSRWAMFDSSVGTLTTVTGAGAVSISFTLAPGVISSLALLDVDASSVTITQTDGGSTIYTKTVDLLTGVDPVTSWYDYVYQDIIRATAVVVNDLVPSSTATVTVTISGTTSVSCGTCVVGKSTELGGAKFGASIGIVDYSVKNTDAYGVITVVQRNFSKRLNTQVVMPSGLVNEAARRLAKIRATPVVWVGVDGYDATVIYGFWKDWSIELAYPTQSYCSLTIEGLT